MNLKKYYLLVVVVATQFVFSQEGIPVYADYLSDNLYLVHPAMAGASNANKIRLTARKQWFDVDNAPNLQSANINFRTGDKAGFGAILFRDQNGRFRQTGVYISAAYHLLFSRDRSDLNMLSFGISPGFIQSSVDLRGLDDPFDPDPVILDRVQKAAYFNMDIGMSYHWMEFYAHFTVKNALPMNRGIFDNPTPIRESNNQRRYLFSVGYLLGLGNEISIEPSILFQTTDETQERTLDINLKGYKGFGKFVLWGGVSYRRSFEGAEFSAGGAAIDSQGLQYITPFLGVNMKKWMIGYTYSYQSNSVVLSDGGFHQITLGYDFGKREERWECNCPAVN